MRKYFQIYIDSCSGLSREVWMLSLVTLINRMGTIVLLFLSIYLSKVLLFSFDQIAIVLSMSGIGSFVGTFIGGKLTDRIGYYYVMLWSLVLTGIGFLILMHISSFYGMCLGMFCTSFVGDAFRPASYTALRAYSKQENRTRSLALIRLAINLGFALGPVMGGLLAEFYGYNWVFIVDGITCILAAITILIFLPRYRISKEEKAKPKEGISPIRNAKFMSFLLMMLLASLTFFQLFTTFPKYLEDHFSMTESTIGMVMALNAVIIIFVEMPLVYKLENVNKLKLIGSGTLCLSLAFSLFIFGFSWFWLPVVAMVIVTVGEMIDFPFSGSWALEQANSSNAGDYMGYYSMSFSLSQILAPYIGFKLIARFGYEFHWAVMTAIAIVAGLGIFWIIKKYKE